MVAATFTIGRTTGLRAQKLFYDGNSLSIAGHILPTTDQVNAVIAVRQQLRGLVHNIDEQAFPVTCSADSSIDGYYRVMSAAANDTATLAGAQGTFAVQLERIWSGYTNVVNECNGSHFLRTSSHAIGAQRGQWSIPETGITTARFISSTPYPVTRTADSGPVRTRFFNTASEVSGTAYFAPPADYNDGAATIECKYSGSTYYPAVGRQVPLSATNWRLTNGILRFQASSTANKLFDLFVYNGSSWSTTPFIVTASGRQDAVIDPGDIAFSVPEVVAASVLRNSPEVCALRLYYRFNTVSGTNSEQVAGTVQQLDLSLRRGDHIATASPLPSKGLGSFTIGENAAGASALLTGGCRTTAAVDGNRFIVGGTTTSTGLTSSWTSTTDRTATRPSFCVGAEVTGSSATGQNVAQEVLYQWFIPFVEQQKVVLR